jgi:hypothetical protein
MAEVAVGTTVTGNQDGSTSVRIDSATEPNEDSKAAGDKTTKVSTNTRIYQLYSQGMCRHNFLLYMPTVKVYLMHCEPRSRMESTSSFSAAIVYQKTRWSAIARGSE